MARKEYRQQLISEIVEMEFISTQDEIIEFLSVRGIKATQATISRDINELQLVRLPTGKGKHRYRLSPLATGTDVMAELSERLRLFVRDIDRGDNTLVLTTDEGQASGVAKILDKLDRDDIVGTLAGHNTIFVVLRTADMAEALLDELEELLY